MREHTYTQVDTHIVVCDDCGAFAATAEAVRHSRDCDEMRARFCSQCGQPFASKACGPTHALLRDQGEAKP